MERTADDLIRLCHVQNLQPEALKRVIAETSDQHLTGPDWNSYCTSASPESSLYIFIEMGGLIMELLIPSRLPAL